MSENNQQRQRTNTRRQTITVPIFPIGEGHRLARRLSSTTSARHRLSNVSQIYLPYGDEYRSQERVPPASADFLRQVVLRPVEDIDGRINQRRLSVISEVSYPIEEEDGRGESMTSERLIPTESSQDRHRILFIIEPIIVGLFLLPIITLFWDCGWNLVHILLKRFNGYSFTLQSDKMITEELRTYSLSSLFISYLIVQILLLIFYLYQDVFYDFLKTQNYVITTILLKCHILLLASVYVVQWETLSIVWDQYTPSEWYFQLVLSLTALFGLIVFIGHLSDLVCAPFLVSYDSIEYCLHFGCPLLTRQVNLFV